MKTAPTVLLALLAGIASAQPTPIDQAKALAGNVSPGDAPYFPVTITRPGSYVLTGNLDVPFHMNAIVIDADNVTLDLGGFEIRSMGQCTRDDTSGWVSCNSSMVGAQQRIAYAGIDVNGRRAVIRNGTVAGFRGHGIYGAGGGLWLDGVTVVHNRHHGVVMQSRGNRVSNSRFALNGENGLHGVMAIVSGSHAHENGEHGMHLSHSVVGHSIASSNRVSGLRGSSGSNPTSVRDSNFQFNKAPAQVSGDIVSGGGNVAGGAAF